MDLVECLYVVKIILSTRILVSSQTCAALFPDGSTTWMMLNAACCSSAVLLIEPRSVWPIFMYYAKCFSS